MLRRAQKNCRAYSNITFEPADINSLNYPEGSFDKVVAGNVIHLLDDPLAALKELDRVCKPGGILIIPTYMNREKKEQDSGFISALDKAGAGFKQQFTASRYKQFFVDAGYKDVKVSMAEGRIPCAVAEQMNVTKPSVTNATRLLREGSFLTMDEDKRIHLTELRREIAESIYRYDTGKQIKCVKKDDRQLTVKIVTDKS